MIRFILSADILSADPAPGAYALLLRLDAPLAVEAGRRGATLQAGLYIYCGSARGSGGMRARLARHMRRDKRLHWHVDQLTRAGRVEGAWIEPGGDECALNRALSHLPVPLAGFGATDCPVCAGHLRFWPAGRPAFAIPPAPGGSRRRGVAESVLEEK